MKHEVDNLVREIFEHGELEYNPAQWQKLKSRLDQEKLKKNNVLGLGLISFLGFKKILAAASVSVLVGTSYYFYMQHTQHQPNLTIIKSGSEKTIKPYENKQETNNSSIPQITGTNHLIASHAIHSTQALQNKGLNTIPSKPKNNLPIIADQKNINSAKETLALQNKNSISTPQATPDKVIDPATFPANEVAEIKKENIIPNADRFKIFEDKKQANNSGQNGLSLFGSIGMGTNQSAYAAGINYTINMSSRFFIDGGLQLSTSKINEVALFSVADEKKLTTFSDGTNNIGGTVLAASFEANNLDLVSQSINYTHLTFNPSFGYRLNKSIFVQAGVDLQQRLSNTKTLNFVAQNDLLIYLPVVDIGLTPKIGYSINKHWQASMLYRKGVNQWIHNRQTFNRDYLQVQLGYKL